MNIAIIPARGGSKRIPRKNIRSFNGKPIIYYPIRCAQKSGLFEKVIVSTDDVEIAEVATSMGAEVPFLRPPELADDHTGTHEVLIHAIQWLLQNGFQPANACCLYPTAPLLDVEDLKKGLNFIETGHWQYVFSATRYSYPIYRAFTNNGDDGLGMIFPEHYKTRSQDLPVVCHDAGQFYWGKTEAWLQKKKVFDRHSTVVEIPNWRVQDIDTEDDWTRAELMSQIIQTMRGSTL